jgi:hypothetical protein
MPRREARPRPTWTDVKARLATFDHLGLLGLIQDLYTAHKENQTFLHARLGLGEDVLKPYKETLDRWLWPDVLRNQDTSVVKAKQAISSYKKAVGDPAGLAELMVFNDIGYQDDAYFNALVRMFEQALKTIAQLPASDRTPLIARIDKVRTISHNFGYGGGRYGLPACEIRWTVSPERAGFRTNHFTQAYRKLTIHSIALGQFRGGCPQTLRQPRVPGLRLSELFKSVP